VNQRREEEQDSQHDGRRHQTSDLGARSGLTIDSRLRGAATRRHGAKQTSYQVR
jgi:hypothetical protein